MARSFNGTSDAITIALNLSAFNRITVAFWLNWTTFANDDDLAMEYSTNFGTNAGSFIIDPNAGVPASGFFYTALGSSAVGGNTIAHFTRPSAGVFHHYACHFDANATGSAAVPATYVDGVSQTLTYDLTIAVGSINFGNYSLYLMSRAASSLFGAGSMAELAIWGGVLLNVNEVVALSKGYSPALIRPGALVEYLPMVRSNVAYMGAAAAPTLTGTTVSVHPNVIYPRKNRIRSTPQITAPPLRAQIWM